MTQQVKNLPAMQETQGIQVQSLGWEDSPGGNGNPLQYSCLKNPIGKKSWIFIGRTDAEAEVPILWPPNTKTSSLEKTLIVGRTEGKRRRGQCRLWWLNSITDSVDMTLSKLREIVEEREASCPVVHGVAKSWTWTSDWITTKCTIYAE